MINVITGAIAGIIGSSAIIGAKLKNYEEDSYIKPKDDRWF